MPISHVQDTTDLQALFGLSGDEELMESFQCSLAQTYKCLHNTFSEAREVCASTPSLLLPAGYVCAVFVLRQAVLTFSRTGHEDGPVEFEMKGSFRRAGDLPWDAVRDR